MAVTRVSDAEGALLVEQAQVLEMIVRGHPLTEVLSALCTVVEQHSEHPVRAVICLVDAGGKHLRIGGAPTLPDAFTRAVDGIAIAPDVGTCAAAAARREVVVTRDLATDPGWAALRHLPRELGLAAAWAMPIMSSTQAVLGTFGTFFTEARHPLAHERRLVEVLARTAALAIERDRADEREARYRAIVEATPECVKLVAADGTLLQMNAAGLRMLGVSSEADAVGRSTYALIAPEHRDTFRGFNEAVCRGEGGTLAFDMVGVDGVRHSMETTAVPLRAPTGDFMHLAVTRDVSARVAADRALAQSRARLDYAVRLSGVGFWYCDLPLAELCWDARAKQHFFLPPDARVTIETFYERMHPEDRARTRAAVDAAIHDRASYDVVFRTVDPRTGAIKWIRALGGSAYARDGTPTHFDGVTVDVTAQKLDEERLARLCDQLREQDRRKDEFLATLAHELRNPLAPIRTGLHVMRSAITAAQAARTLEMMERQLGHLVHMVDDLLDISRVTLGKVTLKKARVDLRDVLDSALETTRTLVETGGHELAVRLPEQPLPIDVDPTRLSQVFANLINNAAKYTPHGGHITIVVEADHAALRVRVSDTGVGIPADMLPYVFDMFTQVGPSLERSQGGLGIGLTLVRRLVEMHGGSVVAESRGAGQGSSFVVTLPLASAGEVSAARRQAPADPVAAGLRILVVDDNADAADTLAMLLELGGHQTRIAHSGPLALDAASEFRPQVVFLDIGLPGLSGYEVARRLRVDAMRPRPLLVALTGWGSEEDRRQAHAAGFDRHLVKPIDASKISAVLADARHALDEPRFDGPIGIGG